MQSLFTHMFHLTPRGAGGLACDDLGVALGPVDLLRVEVDARGRRHCEAPSAAALATVMNAAYGSQSQDLIARVHRSLIRAATALVAGDLCLAGIETVLIGLPDPSPEALGELQKFGTGWQSQPRVPAGESDGGRWTNEDGGGGSRQSTAQDSRQRFGDGVYRPEVDAPRLIPTGGAESEAEPSRRSNGPPDDFTRLEDVFPGLQDHPGLAIPLAPIDGFLGVAALADEANLEATTAQYRQLIADIERIDPTFSYRMLLPENGMAALSWQQRTGLINDLRMQRAAVYYRVLGDIGPLQVETLKFLQNAVDDAYEQASALSDLGRLRPRLSREEAIGNRVDLQVRQELMNLFDSYGIGYGASQNVTINNRDYETSEGVSRYRIPDARLGDVAYDWTLSPKTIGAAQIQGFFRANSQPRAVAIIRPTRIGANSTYLIPRPRDTSQIGPQ